MPRQDTAPELAPDDMPIGRNAGPRAKPLSAREASKLREQLIDLMGPSFDDLDRLLTVTNRSKAKAHIWQTIDDREIEILADAWISWGKQSARGAVAVRVVVANWNRYQAALILGPRMLETIGFYGDNGGFALPFPAPSWRRTRASRATAQRVVVESGPAPSQTVNHTAPTPAATPAPAESVTAPTARADAYADAEARQRAHAATVASYRTSAPESSEVEGAAHVG